MTESVSVVSDGHTRSAEATVAEREEEEFDYERIAKTSRMTGWYDPGQLARTGLDVGISKLVGGRTDYRMLEALDGKQDTFDALADCSELWIDYAADVGDGWNSTYAIASVLASKTLPVKDGT